MFNLQSVVLLLISYFVLPQLTFLPKNVHTLLIVFGPFLLPKLWSLFNTSKAVAQSVPTRPTPPKVQRALNLLFVSTLASLALSLAYFAPENVFLKTQSRLQIESNTLFARLRMLRPVTDEDEVLRAKFAASKTNKLLYIVFGPDSLLNCTWCSTADVANEKRNFFLFSLPKILIPHIAHLGVLGLSTSSLVGAEGSRFRTHITIAGLLLPVIESWYLGSYDITQIEKAKVLQDVDFVHWRTRSLRYLSFVVVDAGLGAILWLTSTNRWLAKPPSMTERLETTTRQAEDLANKLRALGLLSNSINRDPALRGVREEYWQTEGEVIAETVQDEDVAMQINHVLERLDMRGLEGRVGEVADGIVSGIDRLRSASGLSSSDSPT